MGSSERIDPWSSDQSTDYDRMIQKFGLEPVDTSTLPNPGILHRRGVVFAHRDLDIVTDCMKRDSPFGVLTGLMPSGKMHLGHSMVIDQVKWFQNQGGDVTVTVADLEALATRGTPLEKGRDTAIDEYILNYAALGLEPSNTSVYFQSKRSSVQRLGFILGKKTNISEFESIYGFTGETNLAHIQAPLVQAGDIIHPQLDEYGGLRPIVVPVGIDQDPHIRLTRGLAQKTNWFNIKPRKSGGLIVALSIQDSNSLQMGISSDGKIDRAARSKIFERICKILADIGYSDVVPNQKYGTIEVPGASLSDKSLIRMALLRYERELGGLGLAPPCSTYHRFAIGMSGGKMSSSKPETTIFMDDTPDQVSKKIRKAVSGGQPTVEEHRRLGGDCAKDVAFQYLKFFFEEDDKTLSELQSKYESGSILAGEMKQICIDNANEWLKDLSEKRDQWVGNLDDFISSDSK